MLRFVLAACLWAGCARYGVHSMSVERSTQSVTSDMCPILTPPQRSYLILGLISWGDSSIETARRYAETLSISRVCAVEVTTRTFLWTGIVETRVRGAVR